MNVKKIAEEIFKAPTEEELFERIAQNGTFISTSELIKRYSEGEKITSLKETQLKSMFPKGVFYFGAYALNFHKLSKFIIKNSEYYKLFIKNVANNFDWYIMRVQGRNVIRETREPMFNASLFIEAK